MDPDRSFAAACAARPDLHPLVGLHPLDGSSGWVAQDNRSIYFVVVDFAQR